MIYTRHLHLGAEMREEEEEEEGKEDVGECGILEARVNCTKF